jgi:hypothetical protein
LRIRVLGVLSDQFAGGGVDGFHRRVPLGNGDRRIADLPRRRAKLCERAGRNHLDPILSDWGGVAGKSDAGSARTASQPSEVTVAFNYRRAEPLQSACAAQEVCIGRELSVLTSSRVSSTENPASYRVRRCHHCRELRQ